MLSVTLECPPWLARVGPFLAQLPRRSAIAVLEFLGSLAFLSSGVSAVLHSTAIIVLGLWFLDAEPEAGWSTEHLLVTFDVEQPLPEPETLLTASRDASKDRGAASAGGSAAGAAHSPFATREAVSVEVALTSVGEGQPEANGLVGFDADSTGLEQDFGDTGSKVTFFGITAEGRKFAFVVDCSGSMAQDQRFERARAELERSLYELNQYQEYYIAFFNHLAFPMPERQMVKAKTAALRRTSSWIHRALPSGQTDPSVALLQALRLRPNAVFLLTDGEFDPAILKLIYNFQQNREPIPVHTIAFSSREGEQLLEAIANMTGGTYRYVP